MKRNREGESKEVEDKLIWFDWYVNQNPGSEPPTERGLRGRSHLRPNLLL